MVKKLTIVVTLGVFFITGLYCAFAETTAKKADFNKIKPVEEFAGIYELDKNLIGKKIKEAQEYLIRAIGKKEYGVHKYYYPYRDALESKLYTIYTADTVYSFLKIYDFNKNQKILDYIYKCSDFVLSMQNKNKGLKGYGAFHYSYNLITGRPDKKFVVGTTAKTIIMLTRMYQRSGLNKYLEACRLGADWLVSMQKPNGDVQSYKKFRDGSWYNSTKYSLLYNGQVLSALSKVYALTREKKYYNAAKKISENFVSQIERKGCFLGDQYRDRNPISTSWVIMSLLDFSQSTKEEKYKDIALYCSSSLIKRQITDKSDIRRFGRWRGAYSTSGNGWLAEVMAEVYKSCRGTGRKDCAKYKEAIIKVIRWLVQNTYSEKNSSFLPNPEKAKGGLFWNYKNSCIRTDSVFHALNAYLGVWDSLKDGVLLSIPKK